MDNSNTVDEANAPGLPRAEAVVTADLVRRLLQQQHPDLASGALRRAAIGWDNVTYRVGEDHAVRLPRITPAAALIAHEQRWLPVLAQRLPIPVPVPVRVGVPGEGFPWRWSVLRWLAGASGEVTPVPAGEAARFGRFLGALHQPAPSDAPRNTWRGVPLGTRDQEVRSRLEAVAAVPGLLPVPRAHVERWWDRAVEAERDTPDMWVHGDLHPKNILVKDGQIAAVLDWGDMTVGDVANDLAAAWMLFPLSSQADFWEAYGPVSPSTRLRAQGWAIFFGTMLMRCGLDGDDAFGRIGRHTLERLFASGAPMG